MDLVVLGFTSYGECYWSENTHDLNINHVNPSIRSSLLFLLFYLPLSLSCPIMLLPLGIHVCVTSRDSRTDNKDKVMHRWQK